MGNPLLKTADRPPPDRPDGASAPGRAAARPRLLICSEGVPHESRGASLVLYFYYIDRLRRAGYPILHILLLQGDGWAEAAIDAYAAKMASPAGFSVKPVRAARFVQEGRRRHRLAPGPAAEVDMAARGFSPDIILALDVLAAWATRGVPARRLVWLGDLRFQTVLYHALYAARENPLKARHIPSNWLGCRAWLRIYGDTLREADQVVVASHSSVAALAPLGVAASYEPYPWPETTPDAAAAPDSTLPAVPTFLFFGSLGGLGSRSALHLLTGKVFPLLRRRWGGGGFRVLIAGRGELPGWARKAIDGKPEFETLGFVEDIDGLLANCHAVLVPIDVPVGNRSRILTAMAKCCPVIAHANAALGNPDLVDGHTCYLASNAAEFVERMDRAASDREAAQAIVGRALACYRARFGVAPASDRLLARIEALAARVV